MSEANTKMEKKDGLNERKKVKESESEDRCRLVKCCKR